MLPISGTSSIEHVEHNLAAASLRLPDEDYQTLSRVLELSHRDDERACQFLTGLPSFASMEAMAPVNLPA
jgi:hypothetical protein